MRPLEMTALCISYFLLAGVAVNLAYHRVLSHRSLSLSKGFERIAVTLGLPAGTPIQWAGNHRFHHGHADQHGDPHSPRDGFWHAHVGWYIGRKDLLPCAVYALGGPLRTLFDGLWRPRTNQQHNHLAPDVAADPYYRWLSGKGPYLAFAIAHVFVWYGLAFALAGWTGIGILWVELIVIYNLGDAIDSVAHLIGTRPYATEHLARNHWAMGWLTLGEGWHANHHEFPQSARHGLLRGQFDFTWLMICLLEKLGVARDIKVPSLSAVAARVRPACIQETLHV